MFLDYSVGVERYTCSCPIFFCIYSFIKIGFYSIAVKWFHVFQARTSCVHGGLKRYANNYRQKERAGKNLPTIALGITFVHFILKLDRLEQFIEIQYHTDI